METGFKLIGSDVKAGIYSSRFDVISVKFNSKKKSRKMKLSVDKICYIFPPGESKDYEYLKSQRRSADLLV